MSNFANTFDETVALNPVIYYNYFALDRGSVVRDQHEPWPPFIVMPAVRLI